MSNIPKGYRLVPVVPTDDMIVAFAEAWYSRRQTIDDPDMADAYRDMLAVAPAPPQLIYDEAKELESCRSSWEKTGVCVVFADYWLGWLACAQSRAKFGEVV